MSASVYLHLNPVRTKHHGLGKSANRAESGGLVAMDREAAQRRLEALRAFRGSSYGAYAGYAPVPDWLQTNELLERCGGRDACRKHVQQHATRGEAPDGYEDFGGRVALGSQEFLAKVKDWVGRVTKEQPDREQVVKRVSPAAVVKVVERIRGEAWSEFADRHGDSGRDLALYLARRRSGLTLGELGREFGIAEHKMVTAAIKRHETSLAKDSAKRRMVKRCILDMQNMET